MSLSALFLAIFLIVLGMSWIGWLTVSAVALGIIAFVTGILMVLEGLSIFSYSLPARKD